MILTQSVYIFNTKARSGEKKKIYLSFFKQHFHLSKQIVISKPMWEPVRIAKNIFSSSTRDRKSKVSCSFPSIPLCWVFVHELDSFLLSFLPSLSPFWPLFCFIPGHLLLAGGSGPPSQHPPMGAAKGSQWINWSLEQQLPHPEFLLFVPHCSMAKMYIMPCSLSLPQNDLMSCTECDMNSNSSSVLTCSRSLSVGSLLPSKDASGFMYIYV